MNFFLHRALRLVARGIFFRAFVQLQQNGASSGSLRSASKDGHSLMPGARPCPACMAAAPRSTPPAFASSLSPWPRRCFAQDPRGLPTPGNASANGLLQLQRSAAATGKAVAAIGHGMARHRPYACAHVCAMLRACEGRECRPRPRAYVAMLERAVRIGSCVLSTCGDFMCQTIEKNADSFS